MAEPLSKRDKRILDLLLKGSLKYSEIAARCGVSTATISYVRRKSAGRAYLEKRRKTLTKATQIPTDDIRQTTEYATVFALQTLTRLMADGETDAIKLQACQSVLEVSVEISGILARVPSMTDEEFAFIKELASVGYGVDEKMTLAQAMLALDERAKSDPTVNEPPILELVPNL